MSLIGQSRVTRRELLKGMMAAGLALVAGAAQRRESFSVSASSALRGKTEHFPALGLRIDSPVPGAVPEVNFREGFGAVGDGAADDGPAFQRLADAINSGRLPAGSIVQIPEGDYRVVGNDRVTFRRPVILRGAGPQATTIRLEYTAQRSSFLRAQGQGNYVAHSTGLYNGRQEQNRYPNVPFANVGAVPLRGDSVVVVDNPGMFSAGDHVYLLCDDYGAEVDYTPRNKRLEHFLLKQYLTVQSVEGSEVMLDARLRHDFAGGSQRLYQRRPLVGFGIEHLSIDDRNEIPDTEAFNTFIAVEFLGVVHGWVWDVWFLNNTSIPLSVGHSRSTVVSECVFSGARHLGGGGNGYLPQLYYADDCLVEYSTSVAGRHALICNWTCWGNVFRYNRVVGTPNTETHGEYSVENLYLRNDCRESRMEIGGGGTQVHAHDGPFNQILENYGRGIRILKRNDRDNIVLGNWHIDPIVDKGTATVLEGNVRVPPGWDLFEFGPFCGHDHLETAEIARP